ncbi:hypothetical protein Ahy_A07g037129 [Arachis hypogaea]|uniref:Uncharacterized protein n=1 Tax=Arachis hypogaea TaxID=3818 RepID=A0A445CHW4_ARAHY|nr:hypothetical protein Ahy_A07g037129 [Arachis hypogaea]
MSCLSPSTTDQQEDSWSEDKEHGSIASAKDNNIEGIVSDIISSNFPQVTFESIPLFVEFELSFEMSVEADAMEIAKQAEREVLKAVSSVIHVGIQLRLGQPFSHISHDTWDEFPTLAASNGDIGLRPGIELQQKNHNRRNRVCPDFCNLCNAAPSGMDIAMDNLFRGKNNGSWDWKWMEEIGSWYGRSAKRKRVSRSMKKCLSLVTLSLKLSHLSSPVSLTTSGLALKLVVALCLVTVSQLACTFPALVGGGGKSRRSWCWSSSSLFVSSPSHTQSNAFHVLVVGGGRSSTSRDWSSLSSSCFEPRHQLPPRRHSLVSDLLFYFLRPPDSNSLSAKPSRRRRWPDPRDTTA